MFRKKIIYILILIFLGASAAAFRVQAVNEDVLTVFGNKILLNGRAVILRGVAVGSPHFRKVEDEKNSENDYRLIKEEWGANVVRLSMHPGIFSKDREESKRFLEEEVSIARSKGLFVIIDWHVIGEPNGWSKPCANGDSCLYSYEGDFNLAKNFWRYAALKFKGDRGVMFELWNEPKNVSDSIVWQDIRPYMQELYDLIREQGAENIVVAPGVYWTYDLRGIKENPLLGENIAYAWHNYKDFFRHVSWDKALDGLNEIYPIILTEWGFEEDNSISFEETKNNYAEPLQDYIIKKGLHYTAWVWHDSWRPRMFNFGWSGLTSYGRLVQVFLLHPEIVEDRVATQEKNEFALRLDSFISTGAGDSNAIKLGAGERRAVVYSYRLAFTRDPENENEWQDLIKIANGRWPSQRSAAVEIKAKNNFRFIYKRWPDMNNSRDNAAITVMAYGLRQKAANRNLDSERQGLIIFRNIYSRNPGTTEEWNILQAITYSGATR